MGALVAGTAHRDEIRMALDGIADVHFGATAAELFRAALTCTFEALLVESRDADGASVEPAIQLLRHHFPLVPLLIHCDLSAATVREIPTLVRAGADDLVLSGIDDLGTCLHRSIERSGLNRLAEGAATELCALVPRAVRPILGYCLRNAYRPLTVGEVADALGIHRKTLVNRVAAARIPPPSTLIAWCRLLHAARLLDDSDSSVERAAQALRFASGTALRNMLRRYTGMRPTEMRDRGSQECVLAMFRSILGGDGAIAGT